MESPGREEDDFIEHLFLQEDLCPNIAEHVTQCTSLFHLYMTAPDIVPDPGIILEQRTRFLQWASQTDVYGPLNASLDYRLRFSPTLVETIHKLLDEICGTLVSLKPVVDPSHPPRRKRQRISEQSYSEATRRAADDPSYWDNYVDLAKDNTLKITEGIARTVTQLLRLSNTVRQSAIADRAREIGRYTDDEDANNAIAELRLYTECYIRFRFPMAPESLRSALVEANAMRLRRLYYERSYRRRITLSAQNPQTTPTIVRLPRRKGSALVIRFGSGILPKPVTTKGILEPAGPPSMPVMNATTARNSAIRASHTESRIEPPRPESALVNNRMSFPPIPPTHECPYCGLSLKFTSTAETMLWRNHVTRDLEPFVCVFADCLKADQQEAGPQTFETSKDWITHMQRLTYQEHSIKVHSVPETYVKLVSDAAQRPGLKRVQECPFGDDFQPSGELEPSAVFSTQALESHVAAHIKEIALLTLQKLPSDVDETAEGIGSHQPLTDSGSGFASPRASMYSVLYDETLDFEHGSTEDASHNLDHRDQGISASVAIFDLGDKDNSGMTKLHHAVQARNLRLAQSLIHRGASLDSRDSHSRTVMHYASMKQSHAPDIMTLLLNADCKATMNLGDEYGQTALHYAAERGFTDTMRLLVDHGVDICTTDKYWFSPCLWAVVAGQRRATNNLLTMGADANSTSADGKSALAWAASLGWSSIAEMLLEHGASMSNSRNTQVVPLEEAAASGGIFTVRLLLNFAEDPKYRDREGWSAIHWAAEEGHLEIVRLLLDEGANIDAVSFGGTSPLHCAANGGHISIVRLLLSCEADPLKSTRHGWTALHHAAYMGHSHVVQCLLEDDRIRSRTSLQDSHGWSILHLAVHSRDLATINTLLDSSAFGDTLVLFDENGLTAEEWLDLKPTSHHYKAISNLAFVKSRCCRAVTGLRQAAFTGNVPMIKLLLRLGHNINGMNSGRRTALYHAAEKGMFSIVDLLLQMGADPNVLPTGRKTWQDFVSDGDILLRLNQVSHEKRNTDARVKRQIRIALRAQGQPSALERSAPFVPDQSISPSPMPDEKHCNKRKVMSGCRP